jgi:hypothetical protein
MNYWRGRKYCLVVNLHLVEIWVPWKVVPLCLWAYKHMREVLCTLCLISLWLRIFKSKVKFGHFSLKWQLIHFVGELRDIKWNYGNLSKVGFELRFTWDDLNHWLGMRWDDLIHPTFRFPYASLRRAQGAKESSFTHLFTWRDSERAWRWGFRHMLRLAWALPSMEIAIRLRVSVIYWGASSSEEGALEKEGASSVGRT